MHLQEVPHQAEPSAVAEPSGAPLAVAAQSAVADPPSAVADLPCEPPSDVLECVAIVPALVLQQAPVEQAPVEGPVGHTDMADAPACPTEASLQNMKPPAPSSPTSSAHVHSPAVPAVAANAESAVAATCRIQATLLALARSIRRPHSYVGYSAFILMGLLRRCQPCVWEGPERINLINVFAPWALERCNVPVLVDAIAVGLISSGVGNLSMVAISDAHPLSNTSHFVAAIRVPECSVVAGASGFEAVYASKGVAPIATVMDGDCALDAMTMMLGIPPSAGGRSDLRVEISDYLIQRISEPWMQDILVACQEITQADLLMSRSCVAPCGRSVAAPAEPAPAVADLAVVPAEPKDIVQPDDETFAAMRWASKLDDASSVLSLIRSLPTAVVDEQVHLYRRRSDTAVAEAAQRKGPLPKISCGPDSRLATKHLVAHRFHLFFYANATPTDKKLPYGAVKAFIKDNIHWTAKKRPV